MLCSSLRLDHIREVRDVRTKCSRYAGDDVSVLTSKTKEGGSYLRSICGEQWKVRSRRILAWRSTSVGR
jgi:hypothetical protein